MEKLLELEKKLKEYRDELEKMSSPIDMDGQEIDKSEKHKDEKEDKKMIAEALDEHNEKKHGEAKDKNSAYKDMNIKKEEGDVIKMEEVSFAKNGQWSLDKANDVIKPTSDKVQRIAPGGRKDVLDHQGYNHNKEFQGNKVITPEQQVKMKQDHSAKKKASAEVEAAARRAQYRKEGSLK